MNKIDELIREYCPNGVEYKTLEELGNLYGGMTGKSKADFKDGNARYITYMNVFSNIAVDTSRNDFVKIKSNERQRKLVKGDVLFTGSSENPDECGMSSVVVEEPTEPLYLNSFCFIFRLNDTDIFMPDFLKYLFRDTGIRKQIAKTASGVTRFNVSKKRFSKIVIPIPPLEMQKEIVNILDKFTQLEAELSAELDARRKQYEYYRKQLLTFDESVVPFSDLGDVYKFQYGKGNTIPTAGGDYPVYGSNGVVGSHHEYNSEDAPVIGHIGAYAGIVNWGEGKHFVTYNGVICQIKSGIDDRFGYHLLMKQSLRELARDGSQPFVSYDKLNSVKVQIPDIDTQKQIAKILDGFDLLTNGITEGLPAEINARRQQYEYYRTKLLTFQDLAA